MQTTDTISLPASRRDSDFSLERALHMRRSVREFRQAALTQEEVSQLLWAAQGITGGDGLRTAPSGGALYPLELYLVAADVGGLIPGIYRYVSDGHGLKLLLRGDRRREMAQAALGQDCVARAPVILVFAAVPERTTGKYGTRGLRYIHMEIGHAAQNVFLQATALGLGMVVVGAFDDETLRRRLGLPERETPLYLLPVGRP